WSASRASGGSPTPSWWRVASAGSTPRWCFARRARHDRFDQELHRAGRGGADELQSPEVEQGAEIPDAALLAALGGQHEQIDDRGHARGPPGIDELLDDDDPCSVRCSAPDEPEDVGGGVVVPHVQDTLDDVDVRAYRYLAAAVARHDLATVGEGAGW